MNGVNILQIDFKTLNPLDNFPIGKVNFKEPMYDGFLHLDTIINFFQLLGGELFEMYWLDRGEEVPHFFLFFLLLFLL